MEEKKKWRVSGFIDDVGASQVDIMASTEYEAKDKAFEEYDFHSIHDISLITTNN